jgi:O-antigen/teichoic acid export membrane protein
MKDFLPVPPPDSLSEALTNRDVDTMTESAMTDPTHQQLGRTIAKNTAFVMLGTAALKAINFLFGIYVVRRLGDDSFGQYSTVIAFVGLFQIFAELGMSQYVMREIARDRSRTRGLFWNLVTLRLLLSFLGIGGITVAARLTGYAPALVLGVFFYTWTFVLSAFDAAFDTVLTANERFDYVTTLAILGQLAFVVLGSVVLFAGWGFIALVAVGLLAMLPKLALAVWALRRNGLLVWPPEINPRLWPALVKGGIPFGFSSLALTIAFSLDTVMLSKFQPPHVVGWYSVAYGLVLSLAYTLNGFSRAMVPSLARAYVGDKGRVERWFYRSVKYVLLLSLPIAAGGMLVAFPLIRLLYTAEFIPAAPALQIIIWDMPFLLLASFCGNMSAVVGEERAAARIYGLSALANAGLNLLFIPRLGLLGAAFVTVLTDMIASLQFFFLLRGKMHLPNMTSVLVRILAATSVMAGAVLLAGNRSLLTLLPVGFSVYVGLVLGLRLLDSSERETVVHLIRQVLGSRLRAEPVSRS